MRMYWRQFSPQSPLRWAGAKGLRSAGMNTLVGFQGKVQDEELDSCFGLGISVRNALPRDCLLTQLVPSSNGAGRRHSSSVNTCCFAPILPLESIHGAGKTTVREKPRRGKKVNLSIRL